MNKKIKFRHIVLVLFGIINILNQQKVAKIEKFEKELELRHNSKVVAQENVEVDKSNIGIDFNNINYKDLLKLVKKTYNEYNKEKTYTKDDLELFDENELTKTPYENYGRLDYLGRPTAANAILHQSLMPTEERKSISKVKPVGFKNKKYDNIPGKWLYNRSHLIGFALAGENDNERNLITGTRQMNMEMVKYENEIAKFIKQSPNNYVRYRVTPIYNDNELIARGIQIDAIGFGDDSLNFSVYIENKQEGIEINYKNGNSRRVY